MKSHILVCRQRYDGSCTSLNSSNRCVSWISLSRSPTYNDAFSVVASGRSLAWGPEAAAVAAGVGSTDGVSTPAIISVDIEDEPVSTRLEDGLFLFFFFALY